MGVSPKGNHSREASLAEARAAALKERGKADLDAITGSFFKPGIYTPLMPKGSTMTRSMEKTMVQGGSFVFEGDDVLFEHYDESSGAHAGIDDILKAAGAA